MAKVLIFSGSNRVDSYNQALAKLAAKVVEEKGLKATLVDLRDFDMPMYSFDIEANGFPEGALKFKQLMIEHDAFMIASPEYNGSFSPMLKNAIDWASRPSSENEAPLIAFRNKKAALLATSPGGLGGMRGLVMLRMLLANIGVTILGAQVTVPSAHEEFKQGNIEGVSDGVRNKIENQVTELQRLIG